MGSFFDINSPFMRALTKLADVMLVNVLVLIFAIPLIIEQFFMLGPIFLGDVKFAVNYIFYAWLFGIVCSFPLGSALTAMHFVLLKIVRDEESYIAKTFFKAYKDNFKQATILMILQFTAAGILLLDFLLMRDGSGVYRYIVVAASIILYLGSLYIFPLQARFENTLLGTIKNAFLMAVMALPRTIAMGCINLLPILLYYFFDLRIVPVLVLLGIAGPGFLCASLYSETFKKFEPKVEELTEEEEIENAIRKIDDEENK